MLRWSKSYGVRSWGQFSTGLVIAMVSLSSNVLASCDSTVINIDQQLAGLEKKHHRKIGLYALDTNNQHIIAHRAAERFPFQSTVKMVGVSAMLARSNANALLRQQVTVADKDLLPWHPVSGLYRNQKVSYGRLAEGAVSYSDNTAINLIIKRLGGLSDVTSFARKTGNNSFNLKHYEVNLNSSPERDDDTSTPQDMAATLNKVLFGDVLTEENKAKLLYWMRNNTTGNKRIRAGVPLGWMVAEKTGSGHYGVANDIGIAWTTACKPVLLSIYTKGENRTDPYLDAVIAETTEVALNAMIEQSACFSSA